jgi:hypothetical protein
MDEIQQRADLFRGLRKSFDGGETRKTVGVDALARGRAPFQIDVFQVEGEYRLAGQSLPPELA